MSILITMPMDRALTTIDVNTSALHRVAVHIAEAAGLLAAGWEPPATPADPAGAALAGAGGQWATHLADLHNALAATAQALHEVADTYAGADAEAGRWSW